MPTSPRQDGAYPVDASLLFLWTSLEDDELAVLDLASLVSVSDLLHDSAPLGFSR